MQKCITFIANAGLCGMINITHMQHMYGLSEDLYPSKHSLCSLADGLHKAQKAKILKIGIFKIV